MLVDDGIAAAVASCSAHAHSATATRQRKVIPTPGQQRCTARLPNTQSPREKGPEKKQKEKKQDREGGRKAEGGTEGGEGGKYWTTRDRVKALKSNSPQLIKSLIS